MNDRMNRTKPCIVVTAALTLISLLVILCSCTQRSADTHKITFKIGDEVFYVYETAGKENVVCPDAPYREGYDFDGWYVQTSDGRTVDFSAFYQPFRTGYLTEDITVYGVYTAENRYIRLDKSELVMFTEDEQTLSVEYDLPADETISWRSSDDSIVTIDNGTIRAISAGTATIYAETPNVSASCVVTVKSAQLTLSLYISNNLAGTVQCRAREIIPDQPIDPCAHLREDNSNGSYFSGWFYDPSLTSPASLPRTITEDMTLYGDWLEFAEEDFSFKTTIGGVKISKMNNFKGAIIALPSAHEGQVVVDMDSTAFNDHGGKLSTIVIPASMTNIANNFNRCDNLKRIVVAEGNTAYRDVDGVLYTADGATLIRYPIAKDGASYQVETGTVTIGSYAFYKSRYLQSVTLADSVQTLLIRSFAECAALQNVTLSSALSIISTYVFAETTNLSSIQLPDTVTAVGDHAFSGCTGLSELRLSANMINISEGLLEGCVSLRELIIPDKVTAISSLSFAGCGLEKLNIPASISVIAKDALAGDLNITQITVDSSSEYFVTQNGILFDADLTTLIKYPTGLSMASYDVPDSVTVIYPYAFANVKTLTELKISDNVTEMGESALYNTTGLTTLTIPFLGDNAIGGIHYPLGYLFSVPEGYSQEAIRQEYIGKNNKNSHLSAYIPPSLTNITLCGGDVYAGAFQNCRNLQKVVLETGITSIAYHALDGCSALVELVLPDTLTSIAGNSISKCTSLVDLVIPASVTTIGQDAFSASYSLTIYLANAEHISDWDENWNSVYADGEKRALPVYVFSDTHPTEAGNYWHYADGEIALWEDNE